MKIALINDTHFGCRNFNRSISKNQIEFFENQFFPYLEEHNINHIIHLGDLFDNRENLSTKMIHIFKKHFFDVLVEKNIKMDIIIGNHDIAYRHSNKVNSPQSVLNEYSNITIYTEYAEVEYDGLKIAYVPWVNNENVESTIENIKKSKCKVMMGHLELGGFKFQKNGEESKHESPIQKYLNNFDLVLSGHYHTKTNNANIIYLGSQYEMTWADSDDEKGFNIFDTKTLKLTYIVNDNTLFNIITYDNNTTIDDINENKITDKFVKLIINDKESVASFDLFIEKIMMLNPADLKIEDKTLFINNNVDSSDININDTKSMLKNYLQMVEYRNKEQLEKILLKCYDECYESQWFGKEGD